MDFSAGHIGFVVAAYGLTFVCLTVLALSILLKDRRLRSDVLRLEAQRKASRA